MGAGKGLYLVPQSCYFALQFVIFCRIRHESKVVHRLR